MASNSEEISFDDMEVELPPVMERFIDQLKQDRRQLLKNKAFNDPAQLRAFIGQYNYPRMIALVEMLGTALFDTYGLAVSNANNLRRLQGYVASQLKELGADVDEEDLRLPGVSADALDDFQQAFYAVGALLQDKLPQDKDMERAWNRAAGKMSNMVAELMGDAESRDDHEDADRREDDDDDDDREDEPPPPKSNKKKDGKKSKPKEEGTDAKVDAGTDAKVDAEQPAQDGGA